MCAVWCGGWVATREATVPAAATRLHAARAAGQARLRPRASPCRLIGLSIALSPWSMSFALSLESLVLSLFQFLALSFESQVLSFTLSFESIVLFLALSFESLVLALASRLEFGVLSLALSNFEFLVLILALKLESLVLSLTLSFESLVLALALRLESGVLSQALSLSPRYHHWATLDHAGRREVRCESVSPSHWSRS